MGDELKYVQVTRWSIACTYVKEAIKNKGYEAENNALKHNIALPKQVTLLKKQITRTVKQCSSMEVGKK